jgi:hypothetical protein|tara:strand:- start:303 stop:644 length:342 start_codon:yes stop_codon:yes gene_type:complete
MNKTPKKEKTFFETYDLYSDANPKDSVRISYKNKKEVKETINKLEKLYKDGKRPHNRIVQIANVMTQRLRVIKDKNPSIDKGRLEMSKKYFEFLKSRTKKKKDDDRKKMKFIF